MTRETRLPYLWEPIIRGKRRTYYRRAGVRTKLPDRLEPGFHAAYAAAHEAAEAPRRAVPGKHAAGSMGELVGLYRDSPEWRELRPSSQGEYNKVLSILETTFDDLVVAKMPRQFVFKLRDAYAVKDTGKVDADGKPITVATPRRANGIVAVLRILLGWAHNRGRIKENVALRPGRLATGPGFKSWQAADVEAFLASAPEPLRRAALLGLCTGQRKQDCLALLQNARTSETVEDVTLRWISVVQQKTGAVLEIPELPELTAALDAAPAPAEGVEHVLTRADGKPWREDHFNHAFADAVKAAGLSGLGFHGLRKAASGRLVEKGATDGELDAILGHTDPKMTRLYRKQADQKRLASSAMERLK